MSSDLRDLYQEVILDHNRHPRNFGALEGADRSMEGHNPLCGDKLTLFVRLAGDRIAEVSFVGAGCAISKASASLMTDAVKGHTVAEAADMFQAFHEMVTAGAEPSPRQQGGWTPLHAVAQHGPLECARLLLAHGAAHLPAG